MKIAFFDFDGTITKKDSLLDFIRFYVGDINLLGGLIVLSPILILYKLKFIPNYKAKQFVLSWFFKNIKEDDFTKISKEYSLHHINTILKPKAIDKIKWHIDNGHKVVIVSASIESWIKPWCDKNNLDILATKLKFKNNIFTNKFLTKNCYGQEKVNRIKKKYNLEEYSYIYAYGDSRGDKEMLELADERYYKYFK